MNPSYPMIMAPRDRPISVYNPLVGWYTSQYDKGEWPVRGWGYPEGVWYPVPTRWKPLEDGATARFNAPDSEE